MGSVISFLVKAIAAPICATTNVFNGSIIQGEYIDSTKTCVNNVQTGVIVTLVIIIVGAVIFCCFMILQPFIPAMANARLQKKLKLDNQKRDEEFYDKLYSVLQNQNQQPSDDANMQQQFFA